MENTLQFMVERLAKKIGYGDLRTNTEHQKDLVALVNEAANNIYDEYDLPNALAEITIKVTTEKLIALPHYIGELRAVKERVYTSPAFGLKWNLVDMRPRYQLQDWTGGYTMFRVMNKSPLMSKLGSGSKLTVNWLTEEPITPVITIIGSTSFANRYQEQINLDTESVDTSESFIDCAVIRKNIATKGDIEIYDASENLVSFIPSDQNEARFTIVDVGDYPFSLSAGGYWLLDVLFKFPYIPMRNMPDQFIADGFAYSIIDKAVALFTERGEGKEDRAILFDKKSERAVGRKLDDKNQGIDKMISVKPPSEYTYFGSLGCN